MHNSHRKQQVSTAIPVAEILDTSYVAQWKQVSDINNPADIGTRATNIDEPKRNEWVTRLVWMKRTETIRPEKIYLFFASDLENISS